MTHRKRQRLWPDGAAASSLVPCPVCARQVPLPLINSHLDTGCTASEPTPAPPIASHPRRKTELHSQASAPTAKPPASGIPPSDHVSVSPAEFGSPSAREQGESATVAYRLTLYHPASSQQKPGDPVGRRQDASQQGPLKKAASSPGQRGSESPAAAKQQQNPVPSDDEEDAGITAEAEQHRQALQEASFRQTLLRRLTAGGHSALQGHHTIPNFVSPAEEAALLALVDTCVPAWQDSNFNGKHRGKAWGVRMDLRTRRVIPAKVELPSLLQELAARMRQDVPALKTFHPTEANAIDYHRKTGHQLKAHVDDRQLSTGEIATLSLQGACTMTFQTDGRKGAKQTVRVHLPPRTLQVLTGRARYSFTHAIHLADLEDERRVSITFRQSPLTQPGQAC